MWTSINECHILILDLDSLDIKIIRAKYLGALLNTCCFEMHLGSIRTSSLIRSVGFS